MQFRFPNKSYLFVPLALLFALMIPIASASNNPSGGNTPGWAISLDKNQTLTECDELSGQHTADGLWCLDRISNILDNNSQEAPNELSIFLPTTENIGSEYNIRPAIGTNVTISNNSSIQDLIAQKFAKNKSGETIAMTVLITKFDSEDTANTFYEKIAGIIHEKANPRYIIDDSTIDASCIGVEGYLNQTSANDQLYCMKYNLVISVNGRSAWQTNDILDTYSETKDFARIIVNKIAETLSRSDDSVIIPDQAKVQTRSWAQGQINQSDFLSNIQILLDNGQMVIPQVNDTSNSSNNEQHLSELPDWFKTNLLRWAEGKENKTDGTVLWQYLITSKYLTTKPVEKQVINSTTIPSWIKHNAKWWSEGSISDKDFVKGIQYLLQNGVVKIPQAQTPTNSTHSIPLWVKHNAGWWADNQISDDDFIKGIQFMVSNGIIIVQ